MKILLFINKNVGKGRSIESVAAAIQNERKIVP